MLISHQYRFVFLKTHKTAGTSTEIFFEQYCFPELQESHYRQCTINENAVVGCRGKVQFAGKPFYNHMNATLLSRRLGQTTFQEYTKIANIRNPFDLMVSSYLFHDIQIPFKKWIMSKRPVYKEKKFWDTILFMNGQMIVDEIIRFESLAEDIGRVREKIGLPEPTRPLNHYKKTSDAREGRSYTDYYDKDTRRVVEEIFKPYLERFGYSF